MTHNTEIEAMVTHLLMATNAYGYFSEKGITSLRQELGEYLHHQLQKAREEERERAANIVEQYMEDNEYWQPIAGAILEKKVTRKKAYSKLDQDISK